MLEEEAAPKAETGRSVYPFAIVIANSAVAVPPGGTTRRPSWLRSALIGAVIGSKQMTGWSGGAKICAYG